MISELFGKNFEDLAFMINRTPEIMNFTVDPDEHFIQVPLGYYTMVAMTLNAHEISLPEGTNPPLPNLAA